MTKTTTKIETKINNPYQGREGLVYCRVSSKRQETEGSGLQSQEGRCIEDLKSIKVKYIKSFLDSYSGGGDFMNRPAMRAMLAYIDANPHKEFVVNFDDLKRFARDVEFHLKLRAIFRSRNVILRCLNYNFDESPEGKFAELIMAGQAELEREQNRRQVIQKQKARLELGYWSFGSKKGYKIVKDDAHGKISVPHDTEAPLLKKALEGFSTGIFIRRVDACKFLIENGFWKGKTPRKYTDKFTSMLRDPFYVGLIEYKPWGVERRQGRHEAIISFETLERNIKRLGGEMSGKRIRVDLSPDFPLRGLLVCDFCGDHLTAGKSKKKQYAYYLCHNTSCSNYGKSIRKKDIEGQFVMLLQKNVLKPDVGKLVEIMFEKVWNEEVKAFELRKFSIGTFKSSLEDKAKKLTSLIINSKSHSLKKVYEAQLEELGQQIEQIEDNSLEPLDLEIPYRTALDKAVKFLKNPYLIWENLGIEEQHRLFYFIFEEKLRYNQKTGYRTSDKPQFVRLFEQFATQEPLSVDPTGLEPATPSLQMMCSTR